MEEMNLLLCRCPSSKQLRRINSQTTLADYFTGNKNGPALRETTSTVSVSKRALKK
jgi:hypothetical protein